MKIALYFDLENVDSKLNLNKLLESVTLTSIKESAKNSEEQGEPVFAIKLACGNTESISKFRDQMKDLNFHIREAPQVSTMNTKNRADLILSVEAFESLYQKTPEIDLYVFITSDTDFTVIMDKLRKYGKQVWLVTRRADKDKKLFTSSSDKILVIENHFIGERKKNTFTAELEKCLIDLGFTENESEKVKEIIESYEKDLWFAGSGFGKKIRTIIKDFTYTGKRVNCQNKLFEELSRLKFIETKKEDKVDYFKVLA